jgi:DNA-binding transcriptional LysR family regulator
VRCCATWHAVGSISRSPSAHRTHQRASNSSCCITRRRSCTAQAQHPLADRPLLTLQDLRDETILVAATEDSQGFSDRVLSAFRTAGITPRTLADPYPDLGLQAVREGLGVVIYPRSAFPAELDGSAFVPLTPPVEMPFHLAYRAAPKTAAVRSVAQVARTLEHPAGSKAQESASNE